jgi:2'-5' RNA ligase
MVTSADRVRSFVALPCPSQLRASIARAFETWTVSSEGVRWVDPGNSHLTLKFLGDASTDQLDRLDERLRAIAASVGPVEVHAGETGAFPNWKHPRVLWLGLVGAEPIVTLAETIEVAAREVGFEPERRSFSPHLTLARVKRPRSARRVARVVRGWRPSIGVEVVSEIVLYRSDLCSDGARHTPLARYELSGR